jgi:hypothetical protein
MKGQLLFALSLVVCALSWVPRAAAQEPVGDVENACVEQGGQGEVCDTSADCAANAYATVCVERRRGDPTSRRCEIPCEAGEGIDFSAAPAACALGETCVEGKISPGRVGYYCQAGRFRMDLNLLDSCVRHWLEGSAPSSFGDDNACALEGNLNRLLDQNGDRAFDIFDLDLCVLSFLEQPGCDPQEGSCEADDLTACAEDADCGDGLYCDIARRACARDCGYISSRELSTQVLDRQCAGAFKTCDYSRGRCEAVAVEEITCQVDRDCLAGSYCLLGQCAPECARSIDCPDNRWYCTTNNQCRVLPPPEANDGFVFDPRNYTIRFARKDLRLDAVEASAATPVAIIDLQTRRQVLSNPSVSFGYRLEVVYGFKEDAACLKPFVDCADAEQREGESEEACFYRQADCLIDDTEEWVRLLSPFGVVTAAGRPSLSLELNEAAAERLSPGRYTASVRAIYDNGDSDTLQVTYTKPTISGEYEGTLTVGLGGPENALNREQPITFGMKIRVLDEVVRWNELLERHGLEQEGDFLDITQGSLVHASLHGNSTFAFTRTGVRRYVENEIPFIGLYSPQLGRMRLLGFIDVEEDFCVGLNGACEDGRDLHARNLFGRKIRRQIEFIGPYEEAGQRFHGVYREKVSGLSSSYDVTVEGGFRLDQAVADDSGLEEAPRLLEVADAVSFPSLEEVNARLEEEIEAACGAAPRSFTRRELFRAYLAGASRAGDSASDRAIFPTQVKFSSALQTALGLLRGESGGGDVGLYDASVLSLHDFLAGRILPCEGEEPSEAGCVDEAQTRCGLLLYQRALVNGWADRDAVETYELAGRLPLLCADTLQPEGCLTEGAEAPDVFAYQEHNLFWFNLAQIVKFDGDHALSDAFLTLYRNQVNPFQRGAAVDYKRGRLLDAIGRYDEVTAMMLSPQSAAVMHDWPILAYLQTGNNWLATMQSVLSDRLSAVAELADLSRRVFNTTSEDDFLVAQHLMQHEYLYQVYLISLQRDWQGPNFAYEGAAASVFEQGQRVLTQYNPERNGLGVVDGRVYLENDDPTRSNWQHYRDILTGEGGLIPAAREEIDAAVSNLQGSLRDLDALEDRLFLSHADLQHEIDVYCGPPEEVGNLCVRAQMLRAQEDREWERQFDCIFGSNIGESQPNCSDISERFVCSDFKFETRPTDNLYDVARADTNNCQNVLKEVNSASLVQYADALECPFGDATKNFYVSVRGEQRACVGGEAGALLGERARLNQERFDILGSIGTLLKKLNADVESKQVVLDDAYRDFNFRLIRGLVEQGIKTTLNVIETLRNSTNEALEGPDCIFVIGFSNGTDCPQKVAVKTAKSFKELATGALKNIAEGLLEAEGLVREIGLEKTAFYRDIVELEAEFRKAERDIDDLTGQFRLLTTEIYNLDLQLANIEYQVAAASDGYAEEAEFLFDRLVGRESGSTLFGRQLVIGSSGRFREAHQYTYRMLRAFIHQYNLPTGDATVLTNRLLAAVTLDDLEGIISELDRREREYCGQEGLDCDAFSNTEVLRLSLREALFPQLRDVVDPNTGRVVTAGEQFHNIITSPPWVRRRLFGSYTVDQIELPFFLPLNLQQSGPEGPRWLINPLTCGQFLATRAGVDVNHPGNVAVNIKGRNLDEEERQVRYELVRGDTDLVRGCQLESVTEESGQLPTLQYPIRRHIVGYAPQSPLAQQEAPPTFVTRSGPLSSCLNQPERGGDLRDSPSCWRYFARGRSLSSLDWRISIPLQIDNAATENAWISGEGLPEDERPIIDDIVLYFRYSARPVGE